MSTITPMNPTTNTNTTEHRTVCRRGPIALVAVILLGVALAGCMSAEARTFLDRTNALRKTERVAPLKEHDTLTKKADSWARHLASTGSLQHSTLSAGLGSLSWKALGENVGYSTPTSNTLLTIHNKFVSSAAHRKNLVNPNFTHMGVGVATDKAGRVWVVEVFARL